MLCVVLCVAEGIAGIVSTRVEDAAVGFPATLFASTLAATYHATLVVALRDPCMLQHLS